MFRKLKRPMIWLLSALMICACLPVLSAGAEGDVPTLTLFVEEVATIEDYDTNAATLFLEDKFGCNLDFIIAPTGSSEEKANILLNSGDYPDVFYRTVPNLNLYGIEAGILLELSKYVNDPEIMPNLAHIMEIRPTLMPQMKLVDGGIYALPGYTECFHCMYANKMFCNKGLLNELGLEIPTTTDEFYAAMVAFKAAHPDGIAYACCTGGNSVPWAFLTNAFTYSPFSTGTPGNLGLRTHNGAVESIVDDEEYREALRFINKLYAEDLLYEASFTMDGNQLKALLASETPVLFWGAMHNVAYVDGAATPELYANEKPVGPLAGPDGSRYVSYFTPAPYNGAAITNTCENVELAVKLIDYHYSVEGFWVTNEGVEGEQWNYAEPGQMTILGHPAVANRTGAYISGMQNCKWEPRAIQMQIEETCGSWFDESSYDEEDPAFGASFRSKMTSELYAPCYQEEYQTVVPQKFTSDEEEELSMISVTLENYIAQSRISFITGAMNLDTDWDAYVASLADMGLNTAIDLYQTAIDRVS